MTAPRLAPITTPVTCANQQHELRWADGALSAPHHPSADRERALTALGADPSPCLQILDAWNRHVEDLDVLVLAPRGAADTLPTADDDGPAHPGTGVFLATSHHAAAGWTSYRPMSVMHRRRHIDAAERTGHELGMLLGLGPALVHRLAASVIAVWADRIADGDARVAAALPALDAAVYGRVSSALLPWLGEATTLDLTLQGPDEKPVIRRAGRTVSCAVPFTWLRDVWVPGLAVILDRFCLRATHTDGTWRLDTVTRALDDVSAVTISD